jgi:hypothetical protein
VIAYFVHSTSSFEARHDFDEQYNIRTNWVTPHYRFGLGVTAFVPSLVQFKVTEEELAENYDVEMIFGYQCYAKNIKVITPKRPNRFVTFIKSLDSDSQVDKYALHINGNVQKTWKTNAYLARKENTYVADSHVAAKDNNMFWFG